MVVFEGYFLEELIIFGCFIIKNLYILGVVFFFVNDLVKGKVLFILNDDEVFYGVGIYGEKGYCKEVLFFFEILVIELMNKLKSIYCWRKGDNFVIFINGFGVILLME